MSTATLVTGFHSAQSIVNQGFSPGVASWSDPQSLRLSRRGRLARSLVVLSLTVVLAAGYAAQSGAQSGPGAGQGVVSTAASFDVVVVAPGQTLWSIATAYSTGDVSGMVNQIREVNALTSFDLMAGQKLRVPVSTR